MSRERITRRQALKGLGIAAAGAMLAACQPKVVEKVVEKPVEKVVKETVVVAGTPKVVEKVVTPTPAPKGTPEIWVEIGQPDCAAGGNPQKTEAVRKYILDQTGVKVNVYLRPAGTAGTEKLNLLLASGTQPLDLFEGSWPDYKGMILPMDDLLQQYGKNILKGNKPEAWKMMKDWEGTTWGYPRLGMMAHTHFCYFRTDWLQETGKKMPTTWEEMEDVIAAFKKAHPESVVATNSRGDLMTNTLGAFVDVGNSKWVDPADKMLKPVELHPGYKEWIERMNQWWKNGWFQKETFANPDLRAMLKTLTIGTYLGWYSRITMWWEDIRLAAGYKKEDYGFPETLKGPKGLAKTNNNGGNSAYMIPRKSKNPEAVIKFIDWCYQGLPDDPTNVIIVNTGLEKVDWEWVDKSKRTYKLLISPAAKCEEKYSRDFMMVKGMGTEPYHIQLAPDGTVTRQNDHVVKYWDKYNLGKWAIDYDVPYDMALIRQRFPGLADMSRLLDEESIKFITGVRPLSEWSAFLKQVESAGLKQWSEAHTEQYRKYHPA